MTARPDAPEHTAAVDRSNASDADFQQMLATIERVEAAVVLLEKYAEHHSGQAKETRQPFIAAKNAGIADGYRAAVEDLRAALASPAPAPQEAVVAHNHVSFDIKAVGECSACDLYGRVNWLYPSARHAQCDDTCTVDCGACKGKGPR